MKEVKQPDRKRIFYFYAIAIALLFIANMLLPSLIAPKTQSVTYDEFVAMAEKPVRLQRPRFRAAITSWYSPQM